LEYFFAVYKTATSVDLNCNGINDAGAKALASSRVIQVFTGYYPKPVASILDERDPMKRAMYGREIGMFKEAGMPREAPSLVRLSLFAVKTFIGKSIAVTKKKVN
jgi:hypothetical protein